MADKKKVNFNIVEGDVFLSDEVAVIHNAMRLFLDFKNISPRVDVRSMDHQPMVMSLLWMYLQQRNYIVL